MVQLLRYYSCLAAIDATNDDPDEYVPGTEEADDTVE